MSPTGAVDGPRATDSAGGLWAGRALSPQPFAGDDGTAPPAVAAALAALAARRVDRAPAADLLRAERDVVAALAGSRVLVPVIAVLGEGEELTAVEGDKSADMALVTVTGADGLRALSTFTHVGACAAWDATARPVPVEAERAALAAVGEGCDVLVLDVAGPTSLVVRRPALWALGQGLAWVPAPFDPAVHDAVAEAVADVPDLLAVRVEVGRVEVGRLEVGRLEVAGGAETAVVLGVRPGLDQAALDALVGEVAARLGADETVATRVASLSLRVLPA